jgi:hypothetical protein
MPDPEKPPKGPPTQKDPPARRDSPVDEPPGRARDVPVPVRRAPDTRRPGTQREPDPDPDDGDDAPRQEPDNPAPIGDPPAV